MLALGWSATAKIQIRKSPNLCITAISISSGCQLRAPARGRRSLCAPVLWQNAVVLQSLRERKEWKFFGVLPKADTVLAAGWWTALLLRGILPVAFAIAMGVLVGSVQRGDSLAAPLAFTGTIFVLLQVLSPIHQAISSNLGDR